MFESADKAAEYAVAGSAAAVAAAGKAAVAAEPAAADIAAGLAIVRAVAVSAEALFCISCIARHL